MKIVLIATVASLAASTVAAGNKEDDWSGYYAGAYYSSTSGEDVDNVGTWALSGDGISGGFAGYRQGSGKLFFGGEIAVSFEVDLYEEVWPLWYWSSFTDLKATVGYDLGPTLVFTSLGYTYAEMSVEVLGIPPKLYYNGWNASVGAEFKVIDNIFVGAEYMYRLIESDDYGILTSETNSMQIRAGYRF